MTFQKGHDASQILEAFDILSEKLADGANMDVDFETNTTALLSTMVNLHKRQEVRLGAKIQGSSSVFLPTVKNDTGKALSRSFNLDKYVSPLSRKGCLPKSHKHKGRKQFRY